MSTTPCWQVVYSALLDDGCRLIVEHEAASGRYVPMLEFVDKIGRCVGTSECGQPLWVRSLAEAIAQGYVYWYCEWGRAE